LTLWIFKSARKLAHYSLPLPLPAISLPPPTSAAAAARSLPISEASCDAASAAMAFEKIKVANPIVEMDG
jgi:hypothetical protein